MVEDEGANKTGLGRHEGSGSAGVAGLGEGDEVGGTEVIANGLDAAGEVEMGADVEVFDIA